jgi:hypothetical protein
MDILILFFHSTTGSLAVGLAVGKLNTVQYLGYFNILLFNTHTVLFRCFDIVPIFCSFINIFLI